MISFFNKFGNSWIAKGIFFLLGLSMMAFWGLGGISNTSGSDTTALRVGKSKISMQEVSRTFDTERNKMAKISGGYMTPKRAIQAGLLDQVVQQLALRELNAQIQEEIGLVASDEAVRKYIEHNPVFADNLGKFDTNLFYAYLSQLNISQAELANQMRAELANQHLSRTIERMVPRDKNIMKAAALSKKEKREVVGVLLTSENIKTAQPDTQELKDYYEAYMEEFAIPEYRTIRVALFKASDFGNDYDKMVETSRTLEDLLGSGKTLKQAVAELNLNAGQVFTVDANGLDKNGKEIANTMKPVVSEAFLLSEGEATSLIDIENGFIVAGLEKITPQGHKDFASVRGDVEKLWRREQQKSALKENAEKLLTSVQQGQGWQGYTAASYIISQTDGGTLSSEIVSQLLRQKSGSQNALSLPTEKGIFVGYVKRIIPSTINPTEAEMAEAVKDWYQDLLMAVQQSYGKKYPLDVHTNAIQKAFSIYDNQED